MSTILYTTDEHGRLIFSKVTWRAFHIEEDDLQVGKTTIIAATTITHPILSILFVIDII
jgi:hypothetical protein